MNKYMQMAIKEAEKGIKLGHGGPFGSVIIKNGEVVGKGHNRVVANNDSTCHGEVDAIRNAEKNLKTFDLSGCEIYTTSEPCPMCLSACLWANIKAIHYGCTIKDNDRIGFRDEKFENVLHIKRKNLGKDFLMELDRDECLKLFEEYKNIPDKVKY